MNKFSGGAVPAAIIAFLVGAFGGYAINEVRKSGQEIDLEREITRLKDEALQKTER